MLMDTPDAAVRDLRFLRGNDVHWSGDLSPAATSRSKDCWSSSTLVGEDPADGISRGVSVYKGALKVSGREDWQLECWMLHFGRCEFVPESQDSTLERGQFRCLSGHYFDCKAGPSRAYYLESWLSNAATPVYLVLHVHFWTDPAHEFGLPNHVNCRRAWAINLDELQQRADGRVSTALAPPADMSQKDAKVWTQTMDQFVHAEDDLVGERHRAETALRDFHHRFLCRDVTNGLDLWCESGGFCVTGGPTGKVVNKKCMDRPGWNYSIGKPYPYQHSREYPSGFDKPKVSSDLVASVLVQIETARRTQALAAPHRSPVRSTQLPRERAACALADTLIAFADEEEGDLGHLE
jgi:hypothetical protein